MDMKRFALFLLALCAALVPVGAGAPAWAVNVNNLEGLQTALNTTSMEEIVATQTIEITGNATINGNGHTLKLKDSVSGSVINLGAGINVTINNLTIKGSNNTNASGGGIACSNTTDNLTTLTVTNCRFEGNNAASGGAIFFANGTLNAEKCTFTGNTSTGYGGAICVDSTKANVSLSNCTFYNNDGNDGEELYVQQSNSVTVKHCTFINGNADSGTMEISINKSNSDTNKNITVKNSIIYGDVNGVTLDTTCLKLESAPTPTTATVSRVTHTVFNNKTQLADAIGKVARDANITTDQLGNSRENPTSIGAVELNTEPTPTGVTPPSPQICPSRRAGQTPRGSWPR